MKAYKIVYSTPHGHYSLCYGLLPDRFTCEYAINQWTEAPIGGLLVYTDRQHALKFLTKCHPALRPDLRLFLAEAKGRVDLPLLRVDPRPYVEEDVELLWTDGSNGHAVWPEGTRAFRRVKLIEDITPQEAKL